MKNKIVFKDNLTEKHFRSRISFRTEQAVYKVMSGTGLVPQVYSYGRQSITMERLEGKTLGRLYSNCTEEEMFAAARLAGQWFCAFQKEYHSRTGRWLVLGDANPRNFIIYNNVLYGLDFEASRRGDLTRAMGDFLGWYVSENDLIYECYEIIAGIMAQELPRGDIHRAGVLARQTYCPRRSHRRRMKKIRQADCCIIAGGKSSRMGSPKGLLAFEGYTICDKIIYNMELFDNIFISANLPEYSRYGLEVRADRFFDIGPMAALHTAMTYSRKDWVFVCPCDMPFADKEVVYAVFKEFDSPAQAIIVTDGDKPYPVLGLYHKSALPVLEKHIEKGNYRLRSFLDDLNTAYVDFPDKDKLRNINTREDYIKMVE